MLCCLNSIFFFLVVFSRPLSYIKGSLNIRVHLSMKIIFVDPNLVCTFFGNNFLILIMVRNLQNHIIIFWCALKLGGGLLLKILKYFEVMLKYYRIFPRERNCRILIGLCKQGSSI